MVIVDGLASWHKTGQALGSVYTPLKPSHFLYNRRWSLGTPEYGLKRLESELDIPHVVVLPALKQQRAA